MKHKSMKICALGAALLLTLGLTACGDTTQWNTVAGSRYDEMTFTSETLQMVSQNIEDSWFETWYMSGVTPDNFEEMLYDSIYGSFQDEKTYRAIASGYRSWYSAKDELGYNSEASMPEDIRIADVRYYINKDGQLIVEADLIGTTHTAVMEYGLDRDGIPTSIVINVNHSLGEKLTNAGLNTLLGMGMAFFVLILVSLVISLFPVLIRNGEPKKQVSDKELAEKAMDSTLDRIAEQEEEEEGDEIVAVITAAIAAYEAERGDAGDGDGSYQVRSIRRVGSKWRKTA
ncbi:MAG: OadG family protein [Butyrivibrio sp.]|nr:OadG family protein [Butyrivibrio sp.]